MAAKSSDIGDGSGVLVLSMAENEIAGKNPAPVSGQAQDWARWCFAFESRASLLNLRLQKRIEPTANEETEPERLSTSTAESVELARTLFAILVSLCNQERAVNILMNVERHRTDFQQLQTFVNDFLTRGFECNSAGVL